MKKISEKNPIQEALEMSVLKKFPTTTSYVADFPARRSVSRVKEGDFKILEELFSLRSHELSKLKNPVIFSSKMLRDYSLTIMAEHSKQSSPRLMSWGMTHNGWYLTARTTEYRKTGREYSLSDILEENPDQEYFLSEEKMRRFKPFHRIRKIGEISSYQAGLVYSPEGVAPTLTTQSGGALIKSYRDQGIRKLTPIECERLQGFPDNWTQGVNKCQRYKQLGNSVTVNVIEEIAKGF